MWRTASSLELLPIGTKTELGDALITRVKAGDFTRERAVVPLAPGRAQAVLRPHQPGGAARHRDALGGGAAERRPRPATRWPRWRAAPTTPRATSRRATRETVRRKLAAMPHAERLLAVLEGEEEDDSTLGRIFGEELPSGLVLVENISSRAG